MLKKLGLALLLLCTIATNSGISFASSNITQIDISETAIDYAVYVPQSDGNFHNGLLLAYKSDGTITYYNTQGKEAFTLPSEIKPVSDFYDQRAMVVNTRTQLIGFINTKGVLAIPCVYTGGGYFSEGVAHVSNSKEHMLIDRTGKIVSRLTTPYGSEYSFINGLAVAYAPKTGEMGFINTSGELAIPYEYTYARSFSEELALVQNKKGMYGYIDSKGKSVIPFKYKSGTDFSEGLAGVQNSKGKWGFIDKKGKTILAFKYDNVSHFSEGLAIVYNDKGEIGYINKKGKLVIGYRKYVRAFPFKEGIAFVGIKDKTDIQGKYGYMDRQGKMLTKFEFTVQSSSSFENGYAVGLIAQGKAFILTKRTTPVTTPPDQTQADSSAAYLTYSNKDLGFSLELPASWKNKYSIKEIDNYVAFLHTESKLKTRAQGELFVIIRYPGKMTNEQVLLGGGGMRSLVFTTDKYSYVLATPTGVEYSDETEDDYRKMSADIPWILKTVKKY